MRCLTPQAGFFLFLIRKIVWKSFPFWGGEARKLDMKGVAFRLIVDRQFIRTMRIKQ